MLLGAGAALLMVARCALLPLLVAGGAIAGIGGFLRNPWVIGAGIALLLFAAVARTRRRQHSDTGSGPSLRATGYVTARSTLRLLRRAPTATQRR